VTGLDLVTRGLAQASGLSLTSGGLLVIRELPEAPGIQAAGRRVDARLVFDAGELAADLALVAGDLEADNGLETALLLSLFTDARASDEELARFGDTDPRGWWGDSESEFQGDVFGSKLWLLAREKQTNETLNRARDYAQQALDWLREDGIAERVAVDALYPRRGVLGLIVEIERARMPRDRFAFVFEP
jgi:phage gp46-like protein